LRGSTALIQACHYGKLETVKELIKYGASVEQANNKNTTALMRASQEGHADVVELLLQHDCSVNRRNDERMSALMLCSQRGHTKVVKMLIKAGAEIDVVTNQNSTALMLAVKRKHLDTAKMLVASGAELKIKDSKDRTALETAQKRGLVEIAEILTSDAQVKFMQEDSRRVRNFVMVRIWDLLQAERAHIKILGNEISIHKITGNLDNPILQQLCPSKRALVCAMTMPAPAFELITSFVPLPLLYESRLQLLGRRAQIDPDSAVSETMDLIDEVLEEGGLMQAFDQAQVAPPCSFKDWVSCHEFALFTCANILPYAAFHMFQRLPSEIGVGNVMSFYQDAKVKIREERMLSTNFMPSETLLGRHKTNAGHPTISMSLRTLHPPYLRSSCPALTACQPLF
jgi:hypothetical protein